MVCPAAHRSDDAQQYLELLCAVDADIARAYRLSHAFLAMVRERWGAALEAWRAEAMHSDLAALARFARGLQDDLAVITAGLTLAVEQRRHRRPRPSPETGEAPGLRERRLRPPLARVLQAA
jgi:hypothetical protein